MEKLLNSYDKECMKLAMLKHEETFRQQVYELHRLYQIQKILMKDVSQNKRQNQDSRSSRPNTRPGIDLEQPKFDTDETDLELTLGPRIYHHKKIKAAEPVSQSDPGSKFSSSSSGSCNNVKRTTSSTVEELKWGLQMSVLNQERVNDSPRIFQALSLNIT